MPAMISTLPQHKPAECMSEAELVQELRAQGHGSEFRGNASLQDVMRQFNWTRQELEDLCRQEIEPCQESPLVDGYEAQKQPAAAAAAELEKTLRPDSDEEEGLVVEVEEEEICCGFEIAATLVDAVQFGSMANAE
jgi:hypothetical protein